TDLRPSRRSRTRRRRNVVDGGARRPNAAPPPPPATGYGTVEAALAALAEADVSVVRGPDGGPLLAAGRDGAPVVLLFTSPTHEFMSAALHHDTLSARELARSVTAAGAVLSVNPGAAAPLLVPADSLLGPLDPAPVAGAGDPHPTEPWPHTTGRTQ
ncbi:hypothetical protein ACWGIT_30580, partial [Streptomyces cyaneofuscatus]